MMTKANVEAWRIFRIVAEFVEGFETMTDVGPSVSVFGSARIQSNHPYYALATEVAEKISKKGFAIITGGGPGIMAAANKGAQAAKGKSCGIGVQVPFEEEVNPYVDKKYKLDFRYFFVRKVCFVRYAQAFVFLPGGFGTLDELFEALTLIQTKRIRPFPIFLLGTAYWEGLIDWLREKALHEKNLGPEDLSLLTLTDDTDLVADKIEAHFKEQGLQPTYDLEAEEKS